VFFEGWAPCSSPRFAGELGLPEKSTPTWLSGKGKSALAFKPRIRVSLRGPEVRNVVGRVLVHVFDCIADYRLGVLFDVIAYVERIDHFALLDVFDNRKPGRNHDIPDEVLIVQFALFSGHQLLPLQHARRLDFTVAGISARARGIALIIFYQTIPVFSMVL
jgi:hypothetical protein